MPLYEYKCNDCDTKFEELTMRSSDVVTCPKCESENVTRLLSTFASSGGSSKSSAPSCGSGGFS
jgi:putative FmdB family regulatory protein